MILTKKLTRKEVLEALAYLAAQTLPDNADGVLDITYDAEDGVEIVYREPSKEN